MTPDRVPVDGADRHRAGRLVESDRRERAAQVQRRTVRVLAVAQGLGGLGLTIGIAVTALLATEVSGSPTLAGLAQTGQVGGAAAASYLLAIVMGRSGRRPGLSLGYLVGSVGGAMCVLAAVVDSFAVLMVGAVLLGATTAANQQSRYAATDLATAEHRARDLSLVVWATTVGAVLGPNLTGVAGDFGTAVGVPSLAGPYLVGVAGMLLAGGVIVLFLRPDPLLEGRSLEHVVAASPTTAPTAAPTAPPTAQVTSPDTSLDASLVTGRDTSWSRVSVVLRSSPAVMAGIVALSLAHAAMVAVMVMTPLHMHHGGASLEVIGLVISGHVLGMFAFSPAVGWATDRLGRPTALLTGSGVLMTSLVLSGSSPPGGSWQVGAGLFLLGLGWSFCTVAASTLLTEATPSSAVTDVQGAADLVMGLVAAAAGALAGVIVGMFDYPALNVFAALITLGIAGAGLVARRCTPAL